MSESSPEILTPPPALAAISTDETIAKDTAASVEPKKNGKSLVCTRCGSKVLLAESATHIRKKVFLPLMTFKAAVAAVKSVVEESDRVSDVLDNSDALHVLPDVPGEVLHDFWLVSDMYTFENVGVSHTVGGLKYLTCADCEIGPIGFQDLQQKEEFLVAWNRVEEK
ncbi:hypothetical protein BV898_04578 [Hypsibius exemplaris]|uniref:Guanine nucleotide exchange factor MSS4-like protein n=1 Tax=Hypsibius exemplaris TaxID=2072580 RepID=A0A1W0X1K2_HYPEX|nr:hypothetical protein BV898_04578 [Hypsibius exemplaris]